MASVTLTYGRRYQKGLNAITTTAMTGFHVGAIAALFFIDRGAILTAILLYVAAGMFGIGMGYHRLLTHRGYRTYKWVEYFLTGAARSRSKAARSSGSPPTESIISTQIAKATRTLRARAPGGRTSGWILTGEGLHHDASVLARYVPDLMPRPGQVFLSRWHWTSNVMVGLALLAFGGVPYVLWGIFFRTVDWSPRHLAGQLRDSQVGLATLRHARRLDEQLVGRAAHVRRGLAQQPSRPSDERTPRARLVRSGLQLDRHPDAQCARARMGCQDA